MPLIAGDERVAMRFCQEGLERGVFAQAIRPPTVPAGTSRLRLTAMASHTPAELREAAAALGAAARSAGLEPRQLPAPAPEPLEEVIEIETALVRAERLSAAGPFDFERDPGRAASGRAPVPARPSTSFGGEPREPLAQDAPGPGPEVEVEVEMAAQPASVDTPTELFDFERDAARAA